jgi:hypothetical protein
MFEDISMHHVAVDLIAPCHQKMYSRSFVHYVPCSSQFHRSTGIAIVGLLLQDAAIARGWLAEINGIIRSISASRPSRLLVLLNPKGGSGRAAKIWSQKAQPILRLAGKR